MVSVKKIPGQNKKLAHAPNRRATEIYGLDREAFE